MERKVRFGSDTRPVRAKLMAARNVDLPRPFAPARQNTPLSNLTSTVGCVEYREKFVRTRLRILGRFSLGRGFAETFFPELGKRGHPHIDIHSGQLHDASADVRTIDRNLHRSP